MTKESHKYSMFQNAVIRKVAITINRVRYALVLKMYLLNSQLSLQIKSLTFIFIFIFFIYLVKPFVGRI